MSKDIVLLFYDASALLYAREGKGLFAKLCMLSSDLLIQISFGKKDEEMEFEQRSFHHSTPQRQQ
jgi:hypothetical protein